MIYFYSFIWNKINKITGEIIQNINTSHFKFGHNWFGKLEITENQAKDLMFLPFSCFNSLHPSLPPSALSHYRVMK